MTVDQGYFYWVDRDGVKLGPALLLADWEGAQSNPVWADHVETIRQAKWEEPIWLTRDGTVFNRIHRLIRGFIGNAKIITVRVFDELPESAIIPDK